MSREVIVQTDTEQFQDKCDMIDLVRAALKSGFKYERFQYIGTDEYLLRVYSDNGELTTNVSKEELAALGMEV